MQLVNAERDHFGNSFPATIENTTLPISVLGRISLVLVYAGLKPTALIHMPYGFNRPEQEIGRQKTAAAKGLLDEGGLSHKLKLREYIKTGLSEANFYVGADDSSVDLLIQGFTEKNDLKTGLVLGYPKTAVEAYCQGSAKKRDLYSLRFEETEEVFGGLVPFTLFRPSRAHWQEEMEVIRQWAEVIKRVTPRLYQKNLR